jgi:hypothetical protein
MQDYGSRGFGKVNSWWHLVRYVTLERCPKQVLVTEMELSTGRFGGAADRGVLGPLVKPMLGVPPRGLSPT